jgi:cytochrome c peroxidase
MFLKKSSKLLKSLIALLSLVILLLQISPAMAVKLNSTLINGDVKSGPFVNGKPATTADGSLTPIEQLGKDIFFDMNLSSNGKMSCATCHAPETGFVGPDSDINATSAVYPGAVFTRFGNRKPPTAAYGGYSPVFHYDEEQGLWIGGMFWDGRATGETLGDPLAEQAQGPFLNPLEMNMPNAELVCIRVALSDYAKLFEQVWGEGSLDFTNNVDRTYDYIAQSIAAYERSVEVNPFTSKYDYFLNGKAELSPQETKGLELFEGKGKCSSCHISEPGSDNSAPLFTDFTYDNLGIPKNPENPFYSMPKKWNPDGQNWVDLGLGGFLKKAGYPTDVYEPELGKFKVPTLRNVDLRPSTSPEFVKAYGHNGYFKSLKEIVHFYNTRDKEGEDWPKPEYEDTMNTHELGNLGLSPDDEDAIVAFMKTLSDGYTP